MSPARADPQRLIHLIRDYQAIENRLYWRPDVTLGEDASHVRKGTAPRMLAILHSFLLDVFDWLGVIQVSSQMLFYVAHPILAFRLFFLSLHRIK